MSTFILGLIVAWLAEWLFFKFYLKANHCNKASSTAASDTNAVKALETEKQTLSTQVANLEKTISSHTDEQATSTARIAELETALSAKVAELDNTLDTESSQAEADADFATTVAEDESANNLATISGIGPKLHEALNDCGIRSFNHLITGNIDELMTTLKEKGVRFNKANAETWAQQATLAAQGDWSGLKALQAELKG